MKNTILLFLLIFSFFSCQQEKNVEVIEVVLGSNNVEDNIDLFELFESFEFYVIEAVNDYSDELAHIHASNEWLFFVEAYSKKLFKYELKSGKTFSMLKYGVGPGEVQEVSSFQIFKNSLFVLSKPQNKLMVFDFEGRLIYEKKLGFYPSEFSIHNGMILFKSGFFEKSGFLIRKGDIDLNDFENLAEYPILDGQTDFKFSGQLDDKYFSYPFSSKISFIKNNDLKKFIEFSLPNALPQEEIFEHPKIQGYLNDFENPKSYLKKFSIGENEGFFQFSIRNAVKYGILLKSKQFFGANDFNNDGSPFLLLGLPLSNSNGYFYFTINPQFKEWLSIVDDKEQIFKYYERHNKNFADFLRSLDENSPPVIIQVKLKEEI